MRPLMFGLLTALLATAAGAAANEFPVYHAPLADAPIAIDGVLDEPIWQQAPTTTPFVRFRDGAAAKFTTTGQVAYDGEAIYIAFRCQEPEVAGVAAGMAADRPGEVPEFRYGDDSVELFFDPQATRRRYFQWIVNATGAVASGYDGDLSADLPCRAKADLRRGEWTMEVRIPFAAFGQAAAPGDRWGLNLNRTRRGKSGDKTQEQLAWSATKSGFQVPDRFGYLVFGGPPGGRPLDPPSAETTARILGQIRKELTGQSRWTEADLSFEMRNARAQELLALSRLVSRMGADLVTYVRPPIRDEHILPWTAPAREEVGRPIAVAACPGEFEPAAFAVFALKDLAEVTASVTPLKTAGGRTLPASAVELFQVVRWYQGGAGSVFRGRTTLLAELLLKRADLVTVDPLTRTNELSFTGEMAPQDVERLEPLDIPAFESQQFWLTFHLPDDAAAGDYEGSVEIEVAGEPAAAIPLRVRVLDFRLDPSMFIYSLYYTLRLPQLETVEEERAFRARWESEIRNQVDHGINAPSTYIHGGTFPSGDDVLETLLEIQRRAGVSDDAPFICVTCAVGGQRTEEQLEDARRWVRSMLDSVRAHGRQMIYFQGIDEARGERLRAERPAFQAVHDAGGKVFVATYREFFDIIGDLLDVPVVSGELRPELPPRVHALGQQILSYGNPQSGVEKPDLYRRNYGIRLYVAGYDGAMDFAYSPHGDDAWDDFTGEHYRHHAFAYPALGKPVDTIQWEGWREGCDDIRYLTTLLNTMKRLEARGRAAALIADTRAWLGTLTGDEDLDRWRKDLIDRIQRARAAE